MCARRYTRMCAWMWKGNEIPSGIGACYRRSVPAVSHISQNQRASGLIWSHPTCLCVYEREREREREKEWASERERKRASEKEIEIECEREKAREHARERKHDVACANAPLARCRMQEVACGRMERGNIIYACLCVSQEPKRWVHCVTMLQDAQACEHMSCCCTQQHAAAWRFDQMHIPK